MLVSAQLLSFQSKVRGVRARTAWSPLKQSIKAYRSNGEVGKLGKRKLLFLTLGNLNSFRLKLRFKWLKSNWPGLKVLSQKMKLTVNSVKYRTTTSSVTKLSTSTTIEPHLTYKKHLKFSDKHLMLTILSRCVRTNFK